MILITGATGLVGRNLVMQLLHNQVPIRCLVSETTRQTFSWLQDGSVEVITGTLLDEEALFQAVTGVHTIIHLENACWWGRQRDLERVEIVGTRNLVAAARAARVGRVIVLSHLGASPSSAFTLLRIKGQYEEMIRSSGLVYTIIRSGLVFGPEDAFINHIAMMLRWNPVFFLMPGHGEIVLHPIYIHDLIEVIVCSLEAVDVLDETIEIGGPEYITFADMVATIMRVTGMQRVILPIPPYAMRFIIRFYSLIFRRTLMTQQWLDILAASRTARIGNVYTYFGIQPRRFEDTLLTYLPDARLLLPGLVYLFRRRPRGL